MSRVGAIFWFGMAMTACIVMFMINYAVQGLQDDLGKVHKQAVAEQLEIRVLHAEWSYLTQPERLAELNKQFLSLTPIATKQMQQTIGEIPLRTMPSPPFEETASAVPTPAPATGLELPAVTPLDSLFARASTATRSAAVLPAATIALTAPASARPVSDAPGIDALFAQAASAR